MQFVTVVAMGNVVLELKRAICYRCCYGQHRLGVEACDLSSCS